MMHAMSVQITSAERAKEHLRQLMKRWQQFHIEEDFLLEHILNCEKTRVAMKNGKGKIDWKLVQDRFWHWAAIKELIDEAKETQRTTKPHKKRPYSALKERNKTRTKQQRRSA